MNDWEKLLSTVESKLKALDEKIQKKMDGIDAAVNKKLKAHGFGWDTDADENTAAETESARGAENIAEADGGEDEDIEKIAAYLDEKTLHETVDGFLYGDLNVKMKAILPFLGEGDISLILKKLEKSGGEFKGLKLMDIMPFADEMEVDEIFVKYAKEGRIEKEMIPFISEECWHRIVKEYCADENSKLEIDGIYPYLDDKDLKLLFKTYIRRRKRKNA